MFRYFDKAIIFILPLVLVVVLPILQDELVMQSVILIFLVLWYHLITSKYSVFHGLYGLRILSIPSILYISYTVFIAIPSLFVPIVENPTYTTPYLISVFQFYVFFPLGLLIANHIKPVETERIEEMISLPIEGTRIDSYVYELLLSLLIISCGILLLYIVRVDVIPLFVMLSNPKAYLYLFSLREEAMKILEVSFLEKYMFAWLKSILFPIGIIGSLFLWKVYHTRKYFYLFVVFLIAGVFNNSLTVAKAPTASLMLSIIAFYFLLKKQISTRFILGAIIIIFLFPVIVINLTNLPENRDPMNLFTSMLLRLFYIPVEALYQHFIVFPDIHPFLLGQGTNVFSWMHHGGTFDVSNFVSRIWWGDPTTTGYANAIYIGGFWADFGLPGVIMSTFLIGIFVHLFYRYTLILSSYKKSIEYIIVTCSTIGLFTFSFISINFTTLLLTKGVLILLLFMGIISKIKHVTSLNR